MKSEQHEGPNGSSAPKDVFSLCQAERGNDELCQKSDAMDQSFPAKVVLQQSWSNGTNLSLTSEMKDKFDDEDFDQEERNPLLG